VLRIDDPLTPDSEPPPFDGDDADEDDDTPRDPGSVMAAVGQIAAAVLVVFALILGFMGTSAVLRRIFG
jgi:hypothetical protein